MGQKYTFEVERDAWTTSVYIACGGEEIAELKLEADCPYEIAESAAKALIGSLSLMGGQA